MLGRREEKMDSKEDVEGNEKRSNGLICGLI